MEKSLKMCLLNFAGEEPHEQWRELYGAEVIAAEYIPSIGSTLANWSTRVFGVRGG